MEIGERGELYRRKRERHGAVHPRKGRSSSSLMAIVVAFTSVTTCTVVWKFRITDQTTR